MALKLDYIELINNNSFMIILGLITAKNMMAPDVTHIQDLHSTNIIYIAYHLFNLKKEYLNIIWVE